MHVFLHGRCVGRRVDLTVYIYYHPLVSVTLLRVGRQGGSSSRFSPSKTGTVGFPPQWVPFFYKVYSKHLGYLLVLASQPFLIWTVLRVLLLMFLRGIFSTFCLRFHRPISSGVSALVVDILLFVSDVFRGSSKVVCVN